MQLDPKMSLFDAMDAATVVAATPAREPPAAPVFDAEMAALDVEFAHWYESELTLLRRYAILTENPADLVDRNQYPQLLARLSFGLRRSGDVLGRLKAQQRKAEGFTKRAAAVAGMDDLAEYVAQSAIKGEKVKITDDYRKIFVAGSDRVHNANLRCAMLDGMVEQIWTMKIEFREAIQTLRSMAWGGARDGDALSSVATASQEPT